MAMLRRRESCAGKEGEEIRITLYYKELPAFHKTYCWNRLILLCTDVIIASSISLANYVFHFAPTLWPSLFFKKNNISSSSHQCVVVILLPQRHELLPTDDARALGLPRELHHLADGGDSLCSLPHLVDGLVVLANEDSGPEKKRKFYVNLDAAEAKLI